MKIYIALSFLGLFMVIAGYYAGGFPLERGFNLLTIYVFVLWFVFFVGLFADKFNKKDKTEKTGVTK